jgi:hypothetical protein
MAISAPGETEYCFKTFAHGPRSIFRYQKLFIPVINQTVDAPANGILQGMSALAPPASGTFFKRGAKDAFANF